MEQNNQIKHKNKGLIFIVVLLLTITIIASSIGLYAWAKYTTSQSGNATAQVAKWYFDVKLKEGKTGATETTEPIDLASTEFNHVASGKIAPGTSGLFYLVIDTTGTEVDCQYDVSIRLDNCPRNINFYRGTSSSGEPLSVGGTDNTSRTFSFSNYLAVKKDNNGTIVNENGKHEEAIYWEWPYDGMIGGNSSTYDEWDTADANLGTTTMTINVTGTQVLNEPIIENKLSGKTAVFVGDSITYGVGNSNGAKYWEILEDSLELSSVTGMGVAGSCISARSNYGNSNSPLINRYDTIPEADLITIFMGTNDYGHETPLGTINDKRDISFYGALNVILPSLIKKYPNSRIVVVTPLHRYGKGTSGILGTDFTYDYLENGVGANLGDYVNALKQVCSKYSIPVIDLYTVSGLDPSNAEIKTKYMPDGLHPNAEGHEIIADIMKNWLKLYADTFPRLIEDDSSDSIEVQAGNRYDGSHANDLNRASITNNVYLKSGTVISLKDTATYKYGVYQTTSESGTQSTLISGGWITKDYTVESDGWYGIAFARNDNANFDFDNVDSTKFDDYINIAEPDDIEVEIGNRYDGSHANDLNRASITNNVYLKSGTVISLKDTATYKYGVYQTASEFGTQSTLISGGWITNNYVIESDGWYGIAFARNDNTNFDFDNVDSTKFDDYINIVEPGNVENIKVQAGNTYDGSHANDLNRASTSSNIYLTSGTVISLKDTATYKYGVYQIVGTQKTLVSSGWITNNYTIESDGWYGIAFARKDNANFDFDNVDSTELNTYLDL